MKWSIFFAVAIGLLTVLGASLAGQLASTKRWHKRFFWSSAVVIVVLTYFQARMAKEPPTPAEISDAVLSKIQSKTPRGSIANPIAAEIADEVAKNILQAQAIENQQVCVRAFAAAKRLRDLQSGAEAKLKLGRTGSEASADRAEGLYEYTNDQLRQISGEVMFVYADMTTRIKLSSGTPPAVPIQAQQILSTGSLAPPIVLVGGYSYDYSSLSDTAGFLELLTRKVCP